MASLLPSLALVFGLTLARAAYVIPGAEESCSIQGLNCSLSSSNCLDPAWLVSHQYTPSGPDRLDLRISTRLDSEGNLLPVINASWTLRDDGSIMFLKASELQVMVVPTNQNICVRYTFNKILTMRSPSGDQWTLRSDVLVVEPGQIYSLSVDNIPKPELDHSTSSISRNVSVPGCSDPEMKRTKPCIESGAQWSPDIRRSVSGPQRTAVTVDFSPDPLSQRYLVFFRCDHRPAGLVETPKVNGSRLSATFPLNVWALTCCRFHIEIKPFFPHCLNDCQRHKSVLDLCAEPASAPPPGPWCPLPVALGVSAALAVAIGVCVAVICRRKRKDDVTPPSPSPRNIRLEDHPTLLLIYSRDHPLFLEVVLKLAAFLQARCGIVVLLDLLDSSAVSQVGLLRWLELQRNKLRPNDKILVLCSRGVQSKWRAMCGQSLARPQPDDLIGPFLSLFLSDMHRPGSMGRYIAAYFEDISSERDVPSFFDIAVKYKLMKHFEELYFRVLDVEKYQPRKVNHIEGIGPDEYFRCPSGHELRNAVEKFHAFQIENADWFERGETEDADKASLLLADARDPPLIVECVPIVREGPTFFTNEVVVNTDIDHFYTIAPELNNEVSISENEPVLNAAATSQNPSVLELQPDPRPHLAVFESSVLPVNPTEGEDSARFSMGQNVVEAAGFSGRKPEPVEMAEMEVIAENEDESIAENSGSDWTGAGAGASAGPSEPAVAGFQWSKADTSGSDQGYSSQVRTEPDSDDLRALLQLQQELMSDIFDSQ